MARAKKASRRRNRRFSYSRWYRRRRYRRRYPKRSGRRFPKNTEVKSVSKTFSLNTGVTAQASDMIQYYPGYVTIIGTAADAQGSMSIGTGVGINQRIGAKIEPIKLRISGAISLVAKAQNQDTFAPNFWQARCLVYQVKGGNASKPPANGDYHQLALEHSGGNVNAFQLQKLFASFYCTDNTGYRFIFNDWLANNGLAKMPLRRGLGGIFRVLYKKSFWINTQKNPVKQFRFICRTPRRLVYPEKVLNSENNNDVDTQPNNAIYILWIFQPGSFNVDMVPNLNMNYTVDFFYSDK